jgi:hypothetical protein
MGTNGSTGVVLEKTDTAIILGFYGESTKKQGALATVQEFGQYLRSMMM